MDVVYKLWESSWADDAVVQDVKKPLYTRPDRVRDINHKGKVRSHYNFLWQIEAQLGS